MSDTKVVTGLVRFSYCHVHEPHAIGEGDKPKYSVSLIIPKDDEKTLKKIRAAIKAATELGKSSKFGGKIKGIKTPLRDGDEDKEDDEAYEDAFFVNANSHTKPSIVDKDRDEIMTKEEFYSGCYGRASINFYPYKTDQGVKGIACGLNHLQKLKDGDPLGGIIGSAEEDFDDDFDFDDDDLG